MTARTRYLAACRASKRSPSSAAARLERRCLAAWVALYSPRAAAVLRGVPVTTKAPTSRATP